MNNNNTPTPKEWGKQYVELIFNLNTKDSTGTNNYISLVQEIKIRQFISTLLSQQKQELVELVRNNIEKVIVVDSTLETIDNIIKLLENK